MTNENELDVPTAAVSDNENGDIIEFSDFTSRNLIAPIRYSPSKQELYISFHSGARWVYSDVPRDVFDALCAAPSVGGYFDAFIKKNSYPARQQLGNQQ